MTDWESGNGCFGKVPPFRVETTSVSCWHAIPPFNIVKPWPPTDASLLPRPSKPVVKWPPPLPGLCLQLGRAEGGRETWGGTVVLNWGEGGIFHPKRHLATSGDIFDCFHRGMCSWHLVSGSRGCWPPWRPWPPGCTGESPQHLAGPRTSAACGRETLAFGPWLSGGLGWVGGR